MTGFDRQASETDHEPPVDKPLGLSTATAALGSLNGDVVRFGLSAVRLDKKDSGPFGKSDAYLVLSRAGVECIYRTETVKRSLNPRWEPFEIPELVLTGGDHSTAIKFEVFDWDGLKLDFRSMRKGKWFQKKEDDLIGVVTLTLNELKRGTGTWSLVNPKHVAGGAKPKVGYKDSGTLVLDFCKIAPPKSVAEAAAEAGLDNIRPNPFALVGPGLGSSDSTEIKLTEWWSELKHRAGRGKRPDAYQAKLARAGGWLHSKLADGAWDWKEGDFVSVTDIEVPETDHGALWVKVSQSAFDAGTLLWPRSVVPPPGHRTHYEFRYYREGARKIKVPEYRTSPQTAPARSNKLNRFHTAYPPIDCS